jgi:hypothetical protein
MILLSSLPEKPGLQLYTTTPRCDLSLTTKFAYFYFRSCNLGVLYYLSEVLFNFKLVTVLLFKNIAGYTLSFQLPFQCYLVVYSFSETQHVSKSKLYKDSNIIINR